MVKSNQSLSPLASFFESELYRYSAHQVSSFSTTFMPYQVTLVQTYPYHWLEYFEIGLVLKGNGKHMINGESYPLHPGTLFLLSPSDFHSVILTEDQQVELIGIVFTEEMLHEDLKHLLFREGYFFNLDLEPQESTQIQGHLQDILNEVQENNLGYQLMVSALLQHILVNLTRYINQRSLHQKIPLPKTERHPDALQRALIFIHHHFRQPITLEEVASHAFLSSNYFSERFHATLGISFQLYLQNLRLRFAAGLLAATSLTISEILYAAGFNDPSHFGRVFKQVYQLSPREYQKQHKPIQTSSIQ